MLRTQHAACLGYCMLQEPLHIGTLVKKALSAPTLRIAQAPSCGTSMLRHCMLHALRNGMQPLHVGTLVETALSAPTLHIAQAPACGTSMLRHYMLHALRYMLHQRLFVAPAPACRTNNVETHCCCMSRHTHKSLY